MAENRTINVFANPAQQALLAQKHAVVEHYESFVVLSASRSALKQIAKSFLTEDITEEYTVKVDGREVRSAVPHPAALADESMIKSSSVAKSSAAKKAPAPKAMVNKTKGTAALSDRHHHFLVQFIGPVKEEWLAEVARLGGNLREPLDGFVYIVRAKQPVADQIQTLPFVRSVGHFAHRERIAEPLRRNLGEAPSNSAKPLSNRLVLDGVLTIEFLGAAETRAASKAVEALGVEVLDSGTNAGLVTVRVKGTAKQRQKQIRGLSAIHGVRRIQEKTIPQITNDVATGIMGTSLAQANPGLSLTGDGEIIGICDTGLDTGNRSTIHKDFAGRIVAIKSYPISASYDSLVNNPRGDIGSADLNSGHGTHVAGSALGDGTVASVLQGSPKIRGLAHKAQLVFQSIEQEAQWKSFGKGAKPAPYGLYGLPDDLAIIFQFAYDKGARIHCNSWGGASDPGAYDDKCRQLDQYVWDHKDFCILTAAGNEGTDFDGDGKINPFSVSSPATAKNCITVGACESRRPEFNLQTYGGFYGGIWSKRFPTNFAKKDAMANDPNQVVAFSSRGPTLDNRVKPDVVAPGTYILSTRSTKLPPDFIAAAAYPPSSGYFYMGGTSTAAPLTAGAVALIREFLRKKKGIANPTAALLKAALVAGAQRLPGYGNAGSVCDYDQGFGRVNVDAILAPAAPRVSRFADIVAGLKTGAAYSTPIKVNSTSANLRIVLAYSDFPGSNLINNLNLIVTSPTGSVYAGNQRIGGTPTVDTRNNVEVVEVKSPSVGTWTIQVVASSVPKGPQDFALAILGPLK